MSGYFIKPSSQSYPFPASSYEIRKQGVDETIAVSSSPENAQKIVEALGFIDEVLRKKEAFVWTKERELKMTKQWVDGVAAAAIANDLGCSANAVIGKAARLKLGRRREGHPGPKLNRKRH